MRKPKIRQWFAELALGVFKILPGKLACEHCHHSRHVHLSANYLHCGRCNVGGCDCECFSIAADRFCVDCLPPVSDCDSCYESDCACNLVGHRKAPKRQSANQYLASIGIGAVNPVCGACGRESGRIWTEERLCFDCLLEREKQTKPRLAADPARVDPVAAAGQRAGRDREQPQITITRAPRMPMRKLTYRGIVARLRRGERLSIERGYSLTAYFHDSDGAEAPHKAMTKLRKEGHINWPSSGVIEWIERGNDGLTIEERSTRENSGVVVVEPKRPMLITCPLGHQWQGTLEITRRLGAVREGKRGRGYIFDYNYDPARCPECGGQPGRSVPR